MATPSTPLRERIAAITITVLLHALVILAMTRSVGGAPGSPSPRDGNPGGGGDALTVVEYVAVSKQAAAPPAVAPSVTVPQADPVANAPAQQPAAAAAVQASPTADTAAAHDTGAGGGALADDLGMRYLAAVRAAIDRQWQELGGGAIPAGCELAIDQADDGRVLRAWVMHCGDLPIADRIRLETAVMQAQRLPHAGFEAVFQAELRLGW